MTFVTPLFLVAVLAGLIPVVLHLMNRQKAKIMPFSTLRFLRISVQRTRRRKYVQDVLLMSLRIAAFVLIAVALAQPTLSMLGGWLGGGGASAVVLILDNSASMNAVDEPGERWQAARGVAEQLLDQLGERDSIALLPTCGPPRADADQLFQNHEVARQSLDACRPSHQRADLAARLRLADQLLADADAPNKEIYVVTDMQKASWQSLAKDSARVSTDSSSPPPPPIVLVDVHGRPLPNSAIRDVRIWMAGPVAGAPIQATVALAGDPLVEQQEHVELLLDGKVIETSPRIALPAGGSAEYVFHFTIDQPGAHRGEVRLQGEDANAADDRRYFAITVEPHLPVAIVKSGEHEIEYLDDAYYLERALNPVAGGTWAIRTTSLSPADLLREPLEDYAVIYCVNLPALDEAAARRLRDYARRGGHVVWLVGDQVDPVLYAAMNEAVDDELLPARPTAVRQPSSELPDGWRIGWVDQTHPVFGPLSEPASLYQSVVVSRRLETGPIDGERVRVLARLDDGQPLVIERPVGDGSVLMFGVSAHVDQSNLPLRPIFLPLIAGLTFHLADAEATEPQLVVGAPLATRLRGEATAVEIIPPDGEQIRLEVPADQRDVFRFMDTYEPGVYELKFFEGPRQRPAAAAFNLDPDEIPVEALSPETVRNQLGPRTVVVCQDPSDLDATIRELREGTSLMEWFLLIVLAALVAEAYVANRRVDRELPAEARGSTG